jgi:hypothetical protein
MMFITALWVLEQEARWVRSLLGPDTTPGKLTADEIAAIGVFGTMGAVQSFFITAAPYHGLYKMGSSMALDAERITEAISRDRWIGRSPMWRHFNLTWGTKPARSQLAKRLALKIGSRAVPGLGWALLAVDAWSVGKWIGNRWNPFDD